MIDATIDQTPRYAPDHVLISTPYGFHDAPVIRYIAHEPGTHRSPIRSEMRALELVTAYGSRWYGVERAYINSELRMICVGFDPRDEVRSKWTVCEVIA